MQKFQKTSSVVRERNAASDDDDAKAKRNVLCLVITAADVKSRISTATVQSTLCRSSSSSLECAGNRCNVEPVSTHSLLCSGLDRWRLHCETQRACAARRTLQHSGPNWRKIISEIIRIKYSLIRYCATTMIAL